jgi:hypothetical protein
MTTRRSPRSRRLTAAGHPARLATPAAAGAGLAGVAHTLPALPWWAAVPLLLIGILSSLLLALARAVLPQNSADRLAWWLAILNEHRRKSKQPDSD